MEQEELKNRMVVFLSNERIKSVSPEAIYNYFPEFKRAAIDGVLDQLCEAGVLVKFYHVTCDEVHQIEIVEGKGMIGKQMECLKCGKEFELMDNHFLPRYRISK